MKISRALTLSLAIIFGLFGLSLPAYAQNVRVESFRGRDVSAGEIIVKFRNAGIPRSRALAAQDADIQSMDPLGQTGAVLMRSRGRSVEALVQAYALRADVEYVHPNYMFHTANTPNDVFFNMQYALKNTGQSILNHTGTSGADIKATQAWDITQGSRSIVVGVVDTGVDYTHPDLAANMWSAPTSFNVTIRGQVITCAAGTHGYNAINRTCNPMDDKDHGTHVSGIIGASGNNGAGVSGVSPIASIMGLKFLNSSGNGSEADAIDAIDFAIQAKAFFGSSANVRILNNSWGGSDADQALLDEINLANSKNMLFVAAAGNSGTSNDATPFYPANYNAPNMISVASTDYRDALSSFSDFGATTVHIGAPGEFVLSTLPGNTFDFFDGTSMATPMVSGAAALVLAACPSLSTADLRANLLGSVDALTALAGKTTTGGRLNVFRAVSNCIATAPAIFTLSATPAFQALPPSGSATVSVGVTPLNGFTGTITLAATNLPAGMSASFNPPTLSNSTVSSTWTLTGSNVATGTYLVGITATSGSVTQTSGVWIVVPTSIGPGQRISGTLSSGDQPSPEFPIAYSDFYLLTLASSTAITVDEQSTAFDTFLRVLNASGTQVASNNDGGGGTNSRISTTLAAGNYVIEATSEFGGSTGAYTVSINLPTLSSITPATGVQGSSVNVVIAGSSFSSPMTIDAGSGITVSNVNVTSSTSASATFTIDSIASVGVRNVIVTTSQGQSNSISFTVTQSVPTITGITPNVGEAGSTVNVSITGTGFVSASLSVNTSGITGTSTVNSVNSITATFIIARTLQPGSYSVTVSSGGLSSNAVTFTVIPAVTRVDFNSDRKSDLLWYNASTGQTMGWLMNGLTVLGSNNVLLRTDPNFKVIATPDLNGDGNSDLLWYNAATGQTEAWLMNGVTVTSSAILLTDSNWKVTNTADFNGDLKADLLWYNASTGETAVWLMNGLSILGSNYALLLTDPNWKVTGTPDLNGDGKADVLWYNAATGQTGAWLMNGMNLTNAGLLLTDPDWKVSATIDLNGDGKADILWYNAVAGQTGAWLMNGLSLSSGALLLTDPNWKVISTGDLNGDGKTDLIWYSAAAGQTGSWLMNGLNILSGGTVLLKDPNWKVIDTPDLNGDGKADILWYNAATGQTGTWLMNGVSLSGAALLLSDPNWKTIQTGK